MNEIDVDKHQHQSDDILVKVLHISKLVLLKMTQASCMILYIIILPRLIHSQTFNCDSSCGCCGDIMTCPSGTACTADCDEGGNACTDATFNGNGANSFTVDCGGDCMRTTFNMETVTGNVNLNCGGSSKCDGIIMNCGSKINGLYLELWNQWM